MCSSSYDDHSILAGQGTIGLEIIDQVPDVDAVIIPVGGGGLIAGASLALKTLKPDVIIVVCNRQSVGSFMNDDVFSTKIKGVESENCPSFSAALRAGRPVKVETLPTLADGTQSHRDRDL